MTSISTFSVAQHTTSSIALDVVALRPVSPELQATIPSHAHSTLIITSEHHLVLETDIPPSSSAVTAAVPLIALFPIELQMRIIAILDA